MLKQCKHFTDKICFHCAFVFQVYMLESSYCDHKLHIEILLDSNPLSPKLIIYLFTLKCKSNSPMTIVHRIQSGFVLIILKFWRKIRLYLNYAISSPEFQIIHTKSTITEKCVTNIKMCRAGCLR